MCPTSQRGGRTLPGLKERPGSRLRWISSPKACAWPALGQAKGRGKGQERGGPECRTGRITHQAETVTGQGGVKPGDDLSPCRTHPGRREGPGQAEAWVLPTGGLRTAWLWVLWVGRAFVESQRTVVGAGVSPVCHWGVELDTGWGQLGGPDAGVSWHQTLVCQTRQAEPPAPTVGARGHESPSSAAAREDGDQGTTPLVLRGRRPQNHTVRPVGERPRAVQSAQGWGRPCPLLRTEPTGSTEPVCGPRALPPPVRPERLGASPCSWQEGQAPALSRAIGAGHRRGPRASRQQAQPSRARCRHPSQIQVPFGLVTRGAQRAEAWPLGGAHGATLSGRSKHRAQHPNPHDGAETHLSLQVLLLSQGGAAWDDADGRRSGQGGISPQTPASWGL